MADKYFYDGQGQSQDGQVRPSLRYEGNPPGMARLLVSGGPSKTLDAENPFTGLRAPGSAPRPIIPAEGTPVPFAAAQPAPNPFGPAYGNQGQWKGEPAVGALLRPMSAPAAPVAPVIPDTASNINARDILLAGGQQQMASDALRNPNINPTDMRLAAGTQTAPTTNWQPVMDRGRAVLGAPGVRELSRGNYTNVPGDNVGQNTFGVSSIGGGKDVMAIEARAGQLLRETAALGQNYQDPNALSFATGRSEPDMGGQKIGVRQRNALQLAQVNNDAKMREAEITNSTSRANNRDTNATSLQTNATTNDTSLRTHEMTARSAAAAAERDQMNKDREYLASQEKNGAAQAKAEWDMRQQATKNFHEEITNLLPNGPDGKPDKDTAARYTAAIIAQLGGREAELADRAQKGDKKAASDLARLRKEGLGAVSQKERAQFLAGMKAADLAKATATGGLDPTGSTVVDDPRPIAGLKKTSDGFLGLGGEYTSNRGDVIPARHIERDGSWFGGVRNRAYEPLIQK